VSVPLKLAAVGLAKVAATVAASPVKVSRELGVAVQAAVAAGAATPATQWAELARRARAEGAATLAEALAERAAAPASASGRAAADDQEDDGDEGAAPTNTTGGLRLSREQWAAFCAALAGDRAVTSEARGRVGRYAISLKRLQDLGLVTGVQRARQENDTKDDRGTWTGKWRPGAREKFLGSPEIQERALARSIADYSRRIQAGPAARAIGRVVDEDGKKKITMSGLLAVAHVAGERGLLSWLRDPAERRKFPQTLALFHKANGIF
jgi:hypothetical protein